VRIKPRTYWAILMVLSASLSACVYVQADYVGEAEPATGGSQARPKSQFAQFVGVCQASVNPKQTDIWDNLSFIRNDLSWGALQPTSPDEWNEQYLQEWGAQVLRNREQGVEMVATLDYMVPWAARRRAWSYTVGDKRYEVLAGEGDPRNAVVVDLKTGEQKPTTISTGRIPPENVADWENYVERVVSFLSQPPYNVKYFQPWNEAHDEHTGFWCGGLDEYMQTIHLPAARIIRKYGCKVVYGGYPCVGSLKRLVQICDKYNAWNTLDVLDIHYFPLSAWEYLYHRVIAPKKVWGLWQTEIGFTPDTGWVPNNYPRFFHWAITHGWQPDRYRIFQFAYWSPDDPKAYGYKCCLISGSELSHHGQALITLGKLLDSTRVVPYISWRTDPVLHTELNERQSSVEGFLAGRRIVLAIHLMKNNVSALFTDWNRTMDSIHLNWPSTTITVGLPTVPPAQVKSAYRVGIYGSRLPLTIIPDRDGIQLKVPVCDPDDAERRDNRNTPATTFYVTVEQ